MRRRRCIPIMSEGESRATLRLLRLQGFYVRAVYLPDGSRLYLKSRKPIKCVAHHHCTALLSPLTAARKPPTHHKHKRRSKRRKK